MRGHWRVKIDRSLYFLARRVGMRCVELLLNIIIKQLSTIAPFKFQWNFAPIFFPKSASATAIARKWLERNPAAHYCFRWSLLSTCLPRWASSYSSKTKIPLRPLPQGKEANTYAKSIAACARPPRTPKKTHSPQRSSETIFLLILHTLFSYHLSHHRAPPKQQNNTQHHPSHVRLRIGSQ